MGWIALVWIGFLIVGALLVWGAYHFLQDGYSHNKKTIVGYTFIGLIVISLVGAIFLTNQLTNTESYKRWKKSLESEFNGGITRQIKVITESGQNIYNVKGKFDADYTDGRLRWVDENGKVQIVYLGNSATVIVNEIDEQ